MNFPWIPLEIHTPAEQLSGTWHQQTVDLEVPSRLYYSSISGGSSSLLTRALTSERWLETGRAVANDWSKPNSRTPSSSRVPCRLLTLVTLDLQKTEFIACSRPHTEPVDQKRSLSKSSWNSREFSVGRELCYEFSLLFTVEDPPWLWDYWHLTGYNSGPGRPGLQENYPINACARAWDQLLACEFLCFPS